MINYYFYAILFFLVSSPSYAAPPSNLEIEVQKSAQQRCVEQRLPECDEKMCGDADEDCSENCKQTIQNECRYAGE